MGGVGKTTLAQHVFNDPRANEAKFVVKAWVCVSNEFDVFKKIERRIDGKKFPLVLDDVWNENQPKWEEVKKPLIFAAQGSRILVTIRNKEVASTMQSEVHSLKHLHEDHFWKLFAKHVFRDDDDDTQPNPECREISMKIGIENPEDALEVNLKNKRHVERICNYIDSKKVEDVLENLTPSKNLKKLSLFNYGGNKFPNWWSLDDSLPNLVSLVLRNCESCQHLPPLGLLPLLKNLYISGFDEIGIENPEDALEADLKNKRHLVGTENYIDSKKVKDVLENMQPS
ncbi:hypothetical protein V8G54_023795 [Vigna mungo]|uniref:Uncharacterized protein n=1 Tax=Vigna mungo TaxID=3915 RepID=A0AAQ3RSK3_VIGMU